MHTQIHANKPLLAIPAAEYPQRWLKVQQMMAEKGLDLLAAYADDRAVFGPAHARWLANIPVHFEPMCVLVPRTGQPLLLCGPESDEYARLAGRIADVRVLREFTHPDEDYPFSTIQSLAEIATLALGDINSVRRVGLAGGTLMNADTLAAFKRALPGAEWLDVESALCRLRAVKTPSEIEVIRHAYRIAEAGIQAAVGAVHPGVTEREVAAEAETAMRRLGAEGTGIDTIVASGPNSRPILGRSTFRRIEAGEHVLLTVAPRFEGYHAAIGRIVLVGEPAEVVRSALDAACRAQEATFHALKPGIEGRQAEAAGRRVMEAAGLGQYYLYSGIHSVGVIEFEPPIFGPGSPAILEKDMVVSVDIPLFNAPWGGLRVEDGYLITAAGAEKLNETPLILQKPV